MNARRWMALVLALALTLGAVPAAALAEELGAAESTAALQQEESGGAEDASACLLPEEEPEAQDPESAAEPDGDSRAQEEAEQQDSEAEEEPEEKPGELPEEEPLSPAGTVTGFVEDGPVLRLSCDAHRRPALETLTADMPESLRVLVDGTQRSIPVTWYCVGGEYEDERSCYYQFSPRWDTERWPLAQGLSVVEEAPYVAVFFEEEELGAQSAQSVELECYTFFTTKMGLNSAAACGILANIYNECAFKPNNLQQYYEKKLGYTDESYTEAVDNGTYTNFVKDSAGYGLVQFTWWTLKRDLLAYAKKKGTSIGDTQTQLEYLQISLGDKRTAAMKAFPNTAQGAYDAGKYFCDEYEKPGLKDQPVARARLARDTFWPKYKDAYARAESGVANALPAPGLVSLTRTAKGLRFVWEGQAGATRYRVFRKEEGALIWNKLGDTNQLNWTDESVTSGKTWYYTVCCLNSAGQPVSDSDPNGLSMTFWAAPTITSCNNTARGVRLIWRSQGCPAYLVCRKLQGKSDWEAPVQVSGCSWVDEGAKSGKSYVYAVSCANLEGQILSKWQSISILCLKAPVLTKVGNASKGIRMRWKGSSGAKGYWVCRRPLNGKWKRIAVLKGGRSLEYTDKSLAKKYGTKVEYSIRAFSGTTLSGYLNPGTATCRLGAPKLIAASVGKKKLTVRWKKSAGARGYELRLSKGGAKKSVVIEGAKLKYTLSRASLGKGTWKVSVRSWREVGGKRVFSAWGNSKKIKVK